MGFEQFFFIFHFQENSKVFSSSIQNKINLIGEIKFVNTLYLKEEKNDLS